MKKNCEKCNVEFEVKADWQKSCLACFKADKKTIQESTQNEPSYKDTRILRQVLLKISSEQNPKATPEQIIEYAKRLEKAWQEWK